jgi:hypothetical protein
VLCRTVPQWQLHVFKTITQRHLNLPFKLRVL